MTSLKSNKPEELVQRRKLSEAQQVEILNLISLKRPFYFGFRLPYKNYKPFLWTRDFVLKLIMKKCEVQLTENVLVNYLTRWGFPKLNNRKRKQIPCDKDTREWLNRHLVKDENAQIYWIGHIESINLQPCKSVKSNKFTFVPVFSKQGRLNWFTVRGNFSEERQVMLLNSLLSQSHTKIFIIRKNEKHFSNRTVKNWLYNKEKRIEIFPLTESMLYSTSPPLTLS